ncbi:MAG: hypothetical protein WCP55_20840, partial [Lentisphaerota bacterium]
MLKFFQGNNFIISLKKYSYRQLPPLGSLLLRNPVRFSIGKGSIKNNLGFCWRIFRMDYHGAKEEHILRYLTI